MTRHLFLKLICISLITCSVVISPTSAWSQSQSQPTLFEQFREALSEFVAGKPRLIGQSSGKRSAGGTRGFCPQTSVPLTALVPYTNGGLTIAEHPRLWFYIPFSLAPDYSLEFVLIDPTIDANSKEETTFYKNVPDLTSLKIPGLVPIEIPTDKSLEVGKTYHWVVSILCNPGDQEDVSINRSGDLTVNGWIKRIEQPTLNSQLEVASPEEQLEIYAKSGLWIDFLDRLTLLHRERPQDDEISNTWAAIVECFVLNNDENKTEKNGESCSERRSVISSTVP
jgi:Domain of Unknown Function (DUF928)